MEDKQKKVEALKAQLTSVKENLTKISEEIEITRIKIEAMKMAIQIVGVVSKENKIMYDIHTLWEIYNDYLLYQDKNMKIDNDYLNRIEDLNAQIDELAF